MERFASFYQKYFFSYENLIGVIFALFLIAFMFLPTIIFGVGNFYDMRFHMSWFLSVREQIGHGQLYPRWLPDQMSGMGSPAFYFYPPFATYFFILTDFLTFNSLPPQNLIPFASFFMTCLSGGTFFIWVKNFASRYAAFFLSVFYAIAPYHFGVDYHSRGAMAEFAAFIWVPLIFAGIYGIIEKQKIFWMPILCIGIAGLFFTHLLTALIIGPPAALYSLLLLLKSPHKIKSVITLGVSGLTGMGLATAYYLPALSLFNEINNAALYQWAIDDSFITRVFSEADAAKKNSLMQVFIVASLYLGVAATVAFAALREKNIRPVLFWVGICVFSYFIMSGFFSFIFAQPSPYRDIQFVWRILTIMEFAAITAVAILLRNGLMSGINRIARIFSILILITLIALQCYHVIDRTRGAKQRQSIMTTETVLQRFSPPEYFPGGTDFTIDDMPQRLGDYKIQDDLARIVEGSGKILSVEKDNTDFIIRYSSVEPVTINLKQFYFPGWQARTDGIDLEITPATKDSLISVQAPAGDHRLIMSRVQTDIENMAKTISFISILSLILIGIYVMKGRIKNYRSCGV